MCSHRTARLFYCELNDCLPFFTELSSRVFFSSTLIKTIIICSSFSQLFLFLISFSVTTIFPIAFSVIFWFTACSLIGIIARTWKLIKNWKNCSYLRVIRTRDLFGSFCVLCSNYVDLVSNNIVFTNFLSHNAASLACLMRIVFRWAFFHYDHLMIMFH